MPQVKRVKIVNIAGSAMDFFFQWHLTEKCNLHCLHCYQEILSLTPEGLELVNGDPLFRQMESGPAKEDLGSIPLGGCAAGVSGLTLMADGTVTPCRRWAACRGCRAMAYAFSRAEGLPQLVGEDPQCFLEP